MAKTPEIDVRDRKKNYFINGDMRIAQRGTSFSSAGPGTHGVDRFQYIKSGAMVHTVSQDTDVPSLAEAGYLFINSLRLNLTTPDDSVGPTDYCAVGQIIEGYNWANLAQKPFTIGFWVKATTPGIYTVAAQNSLPDRGYAAEYTINQSDTWEYKTVTITASPVAGTWNYTNGAGLKVWWSLVSGSAFQVTSGSWQSATVLGTSTQVNGVSTGSTNFRITGVSINEGVEALPFRLFAQDFQGELAACQRYYEKSYDLTVNPGSPTIDGTFHYPVDAANANCSTSVLYKVNKRSSTASIVYWDQGGLISRFTGLDGGYAASGNQTGGSIVAQSHYDFVFRPSTGSGRVAIAFGWASDAELN